MRVALIVELGEAPEGWVEFEMGVLVVDEEGLEEGFWAGEVSGVGEGVLVEVEPLGDGLGACVSRYSRFVMPNFSLQATTASSAVRRIVTRSSGRIVL